MSILLHREKSPDRILPQEKHVNRKNFGTFQSGRVANVGTFSEQNKTALMLAALLLGLLVLGGQRCKDLIALTDAAPFCDLPSLSLARPQMIFE